MAKRTSAAEQITAAATAAASEPMALADYIAAHESSAASFAKRIGVAPSSISRILGGREPLVSTAFKIEDGTDGLVTARSLCPASA